MSISEPFIRRPVATALLAIGLMLAGTVAYFLLPVASLPAFDLPTIRVMATPARRRSGDDGGERRRAARTAPVRDFRRHAS